ncbi:MAG: hypothetical protein M5U26_18420 [Planctomycetota bacterium]|nr:hypothetical protein [Planctomycetota bacterium]
MPARLSLSPSILHQRLMRELDLPLAYRRGEVKAWQKKLRPKVSELVGMGAFAGKRAALKPRVLWRREHELGRIEKLAFVAEPHCDAVAYVCTPRAVKPPYPWFVCLQGHSTGMHNSIAVERDDETKPIEVAGDRDFGLGCLRRGIAALCLEQRAFGLRREQAQKKISQHGCHDATMHALMLGRTLIGERVFDVDRGLDYLETRGDVDWNKVGVMGNSGGGTISVFAAALLPRLRFCMPSCYFCTFKDSIMSIYHCMDNYVPGLLQYAEMADVMGLFAPKPVVVVAGKTDGIFPVKAVRKAFADLKRIYKAAGAEDHCHLAVGPEGHRFYADLAWPKMLKELR